jgi:NAD(P)-dependent dehydrogenase (short-subunit alcohol dehydrogenase family)
MSFEGKAAVVAGAGGGMGLAIANDLIAAGARVCLADIKPRPEEVRGGPGESLYRQGDLSDEAFVAETIDQTVAAYGRLDYLINTVGVLWFERDRSLLEIDLDVWDQVLDVNLRSHMLTVRHAVPHLRASGGGAIVLFSSIQALRGDRMAQDAYGASKGALRSLSKSIAIQFAPDNIRCNVILPGATLSPMQARWQGKEAEVSRHIPLGRIGTPQDQANACLFLLSDKAAFITGAELTVDGGITAEA